MHFWLHHTVHCAEKIVSVRLPPGSASAERVGQGEVGLGHPQDDMHMEAARLGCKNTMVGTGWANSCPGCMGRLRKRCSPLVGGSFLAGKAAWALSGCRATESADYCMLVNEWMWLRS